MPPKPAAKPAAATVDKYKQAGAKGFHDAQWGAAEETGMTAADMEAAGVDDKLPDAQQRLKAAPARPAKRQLKTG